MQNDPNLNNSNLKNLDQRTKFISEQDLVNSLKVIYTCLEVDT
jgi:hypothetical protein